MQIEEAGGNGYEKEEHELNAMLTDELDISLLQGMRAKKSGLLDERP